MIQIAMLQFDSMDGGWFKTPEKGGLVQSTEMNI